MWVQRSQATHVELIQQLPEVALVDDLPVLSVIGAYNLICFVCIEKHIIWDATMCYLQNIVNV